MLSMSKLTKQDILDAIRRTAKENGDTPLGMGRFEKETGITEHSLLKYWSTFGAAQQEAGFAANTLNAAHDEEFVFKSIASLIRELGKFPTYRDLVVKRNNDSKFPSPTSIQRLGGKKDIARKISEWAALNGYDDIANICKVIIIETENQKENSDDSKGEVLGEVYLFKSGRYYKIGKTNDTVRRGSELRIQLPEKMDLIHSIKTDDPSGIEAYWHRRFDAKRMNGEWFDLNSIDVKAFKQWRRIV